MKLTQDPKRSGSMHTSRTHSPSPSTSTYSSPSAAREAVGLAEPRSIIGSFHSSMDAQELLMSNKQALSAVLEGPSPSGSAFRSATMLCGDAYLARANGLL